MFDGGEVPIDHYIIQLDNGTQLETTDPTHRFDIMYSILHCQSTSQPTTVQDTVIPSHLTLSIEVRSVTLYFC